MVVACGGLITAVIPSGTCSPKQYGCHAYTLPSAYFSLEAPRSQPPKRDRLSICLTQDRDYLLVRKSRLAHSLLRFGGQSPKYSLVRKSRSRSLVLSLGLALWRRRRLK